jgi:hypothetical protein
MAREFWRFVMVQEYVGKLGATALEYPPKVIVTMKSDAKRFFAFAS